MILYETMKDAFDKAIYVHFNDDFGVIFVWYGGHMIHMYDSRLKEIDVKNIGDFSKSPSAVTLSQVEKSIGEWIEELEDDVC